MKSIKIITLGLFFMAISASLLAQGSPHHHKRFGNAEDKIAKMTEELDLSPEQVTQLKAIHEKYAPNIQELRTQTKENRQQNFEAFKEIRQAQKAEFQEVLTEEQMTLFQQKRQERRGKFRKNRHHSNKHNGDKKDRHILKKEVRSYVKTNAIPTLQSQRAKLERSISSEDKAVIEALRAKIEPVKLQLKEKRKEMKRNFRSGEEPTEEERSALRTLKDEHHKDMEQVRILADKYGEQIEVLKAEIKTDIQQWRTDIREMAQKHFEENGTDAPMKRFHHHQRGMGKHSFLKHRWLSKAGFLLLDPNKDYTKELSETINQNSEERTVNVFPNPTYQANTIEFEVNKAGNVRIDLVSRSGAFIRTILDEYKLEGKHQLKVDISNLTEHLYYYQISDESGQTTKEFIVK
ncbi:MAG: T9SS type A sorting domain-containing protein [Chitinophagales bacterium]